jgi:hypothetical protein
MGKLDDASGTDRRTSVLDRPEDRATPRTPAVAEPEPRDRVGIALMGVATAVTAAAVVAIVWVTSGGDEASTARTYDAARTPSATAPATSDVVLPAPVTPSAPAATTTGAPAPGTASAPGTAAPSTATGGTAVPAGWEPRTFEGVTFAVPPGATAPDVVDPGNADAAALFSWTGPSLGGEVYSQVSMWVYPAANAPTLGPEYQPITVPGADRAHMFTGPTGGDPASTVVDVHVLAGSRYVNLTATVAPGAAGEQTVRDLVASLSVG